MVKRFVLLSVVMWGTLASVADEVAADSVPPQELHEIVVKGSSVVRKGNAIILHPTKRDRRFASGGVDVLSNMHLPEIVVNPLTGEVTGSDGEKVAMFVDYLPASAQQMREIRPQDIERIDILRSPEDPRFEGARLVANYVMKKYAYGGYTKLDGSQYIPFFSSKYDLYSKFTKGRMTYDISTGINYLRENDHGGSDEISHYRIGTLELDRTSLTDHYKGRQIAPRVSGRAIYRADGVTISNQAGFNYSRRKPYEQSGHVAFSDLFDSSESFMQGSKYNKSAIWNGNYYFRLSPVWSMNFSGNFDWSENKDYTSYKYGSDNPIVNDITENIAHASGSLSLSRQFKRHNLSLIAAGGWTRNKLNYFSDADGSVYHRDGYGQVGASVNLNFDGFSINPSLRVSLSSEKVNDVSYTRLLTKAFIPFYKQVTRRSSVSGAFEFAIGAPAASQLSPVLVRSNEIDAVRGNENLKNYRFYNVRVGYSHNFGSWLAGRVEARFNCQDNVLAPVYNIEYTAQGLPMMVCDVINDGSVTNTSLTASLSGNYFDNKLSVSLAGTVGVYSQRGLRHRNQFTSQFWADASYFAGNFKFEAYVSPSVTQYSQWRDYKSPLFWYVSAAYSVSNFYIDVRFSNPFVKSYAEAWNTIIAENYSSHQTEYSQFYHQSVKLTLSYSFGYGKKLNRNDEVGKLEGSESIILKNHP